MLKKYNKKITVCGCDEAGRGCLAGPVVAAAVILPNDFYNRELDDSKKLPEGKRELLREELERESLAFGIGIVEPERIDEVNILNASFEAMHKAIDQIKIKIDLLLIDGNRFNKYKIDHECIIKGDGIYYSIAAASIFAKTERDRIMKNLHFEFPEYNWKSNKGYPSLHHRNAVKKFGSCKYHRKTFRIS